MDFCIGKLRQKRGIILNVEWQIDDFLCLMSEALCDSPDFRFSDSCWCLRMLSLADDSKDRIELDLKRKEGASRETITFQFGLQKADGTLRFQDSVTWKFVDNRGYPGKELLKRSLLLQQKSEWLPSDVLTIVCRLKKLFPPQESNGMCADFNRIFASKKFSDVTIHVGQEVFPAHKFILAAFSPVFEGMFEPETSEEDSGTVNIEDCDPESFKTFLHFLYTGSADITERNVLDLYRTARNYLVRELMSHCITFMADNLSVDNVCDVATLGEEYTDYNLEYLCGLFFEDNVGSIIRTSKWESFMKEQHLMANRLLCWGIPNRVMRL